MSLTAIFGIGNRLMSISISNKREGGRFHAYKGI